MASESVATKLERASASIDGVAAIVMTFVDTEEHGTARAAFACAEFLERISSELDDLAVLVHKGAARKSA